MFLHIASFLVIMTAIMLCSNRIHLFNFIIFIYHPYINDKSIIIICIIHVNILLLLLIIIIVLYVDESIVVYM